ncbi:hypothetical protein LTR64_003445 [Lithohypha guttulata]|uniref:uncharacterized protein n=1 Tax=Lithohypha guttulata TaxID=1690604 RepID=UPI002DE08A25|nr:hypothetical protein LTR51_000336 [Lithohypha guttulata]
MAELSSQDVVNHSQSVGDVLPSDVPVTTSQPTSLSGDGREVAEVKENGVHLNSNLSAQDDQVLEDSTARSDTDTSRADGEAKSTDARPVKKFATAKPVSFAKYNVPKVIAANVAKAQADKATLSTAPAPQPTLAGRPRLVAKTTASLSQKPKPFKSAAPDPMQVWNKNRITPQPSTKNLTDEELKQQYGIHLTSRLQADEDGKEAKWADIDDDDEDDWAPDTIEWNDGTKSTVHPDQAPATKSATTSKPSTPAAEAPRPILETKPSATFSTSIGPNATVLKLGARAETQQQAQKVAQQLKGSNDKSNTSSSNTPAPVPAKSPWAKLPPVEKASPVEIMPLPVMSSHPVPYSAGPPHALARPAREISADDFNRSGRDLTQPQLFMPNSGRYESVPEKSRRMSRNDQGFRPPALLQRPGQADPSAPEPSPAFQTHRTSFDVIRRRASSTLSGEAAQMARRMSIKSGETPVSIGDSAIAEGTESPTVPKPSQPATPAFQARGGDYMSGPGQTDAELEAQRAQQRRLMKEQAELARRRRLEDEARQEAEKQERIRQKLASLGPDPKTLKAEQDAKAKAEAEANAKSVENDKASGVATKERLVPERTVPSPPKPPQPTATGEPQQYGMMKVHPLDSLKKNISPTAQQPNAKPLANVQTLQPAVDEVSPEPPAASTNGVRSEDDADHVPAAMSPVPEPIPRANRPVAEVRMNWVRNDHRSPQSGNLWGAPHNKALGNGTFDQTLAGYAPQDLSSRASSTGQGWMNGRTPTVGQSPQLAHANQHVPETRSQALQNMTSPEPLPLAMNSEIDSMLPVRPPVPIGPPVQYHSSPLQSTALVNGNGAAPSSAAIAGWNNFGNVARVQERNEYEQYQREVAAKREDEKRNGVRPQANYNFDETFKQVQLGAQPDQRHITSITQSSMSPPNMFGAVGSMPPSVIGSQTNRGSRFFPTQVNGVPAQQPRAVTYTHIEVSRTPSPPPAEYSGSSHPAYENFSPIPIIRLPPEKAVVKLPPATPPTPPAPAVTIAPETSPQPVMPAPTSQPMTWAARVSMPPPKPAAPLRAVSQPIVKNPSWQERFNGLLGNNHRKQSDANQAAQFSGQAQPVLAVASATKEPLDVMPTRSAAVSLPRSSSATTTDGSKFTSKDVEDEEDLFEDREAGSLPILYFPNDAPAISWPRAIPGRIAPTPPDAQSAFMFMGSPWREERTTKPQFAIVRAPGSEKSVRRDLPIKPTTTTNINPRNHPRQSSSVRRGHRGGRSRPTPAKA